ncbi:vesicular integral-membrane protein VIP36 [Trichonephila inaurata madagascariensis]|uniref:Vesicular integral-membrane protein VIP36 n=1 Tax=Trichonephila inaurata madagascariensis TaxID=2747483 RepID=A0A8X7CH03_9ARAC|nr:vesicular integral-membrane protein VIP36 [Trichonephila inaurata madagascariensis]
MDLCIMITHDRDGTHTELAGCEAKFRNADHDTHLSIRFEKDVLTKAIDYEEDRAKLLKGLASISWISTQDVLCTTNVRPEVEYGSEAFITISRDKFGKIGYFPETCYESTPIASMELQAGLEPLHDYR